ncbi:acyltransferase [Mucilaginibacter mali]|uniref:Acyltransferase n=1 Tax=Mucilaginibacter mali TaxID=2740462 RepID=A0A7D4QC41_9SPHI|nr:acyltransferase [Mucilaginibacter mali]QKJ30984.1 acyltransferase [Mucilaginibacter mali]
MTTENLRNNNFDLLRFLLATLVIFSHCYVIYYGKLFDIEPGMILTRNQTDLGGIAVDFFFIISGFLILQSYLYSGGIFKYLKKRFLRIYPGYFVAFVLSILLFGPLGTLPDHSMASLKHYFVTIDKKLLLLNIFTLQKPVGGQCFTWLPLKAQLNESLWTIEYEFICYLLLPLLLFRWLIGKKWPIVASFIVIYVAVILQHFFPSAVTEKHFPVALLYVVDPVLIPRLMVYFLAGACFYLYKEKIRRVDSIALIAFVITVISCVWIKAIDLVLPFTGTYLVFYLAFHPRIKFHSFAKKGDLSYGMYLYAWPVQQLLTYFLYKHLSPVRLFVLAVPLTYLLAWLSWHCVEKVFLQFKNRRVAPKAAVLNHP